MFEKISVTKAPRPEAATGGKAKDGHDAEADDHHGQKCAFRNVM